MPPLKKIKRQKNQNNTFVGMEFCERGAELEATGSILGCVSCAAEYYT